MPIIIIEMEIAILPGFKNYFFFFLSPVGFTNTIPCILAVKRNSNPGSVQEIILRFLSLLAVKMLTDLLESVWVFLIS